MHQRIKNPKSECPDIRIRLPKHKWPRSWSRVEDPVVPLERNLYGHFLGGLSTERQLENVLLKHGWEKSSELGMIIVFRKHSAAQLPQQTLSKDDMTKKDHRDVQTRLIPASTPLHLLTTFNCTLFKKRSRDQPQKRWHP